jgi:hypothetical protein
MKKAALLGQPFFYIANQLFRLASYSPDPS